MKIFNHYYKPSYNICNQEKTEKCIDCSLEDMMLETDFNARMTLSYTENDRRYWNERNGARVVANEGCRYGASVVFRKNRIKGKILRDFLKDIAEVISGAGEAIKTRKLALTTEFSGKRDAITHEFKLDLERAVRDKERAETLQRQLSVKQSELSQLGLFEVKKKKDIKQAIEEIKEEISSLVSEDDVRKNFDKMLADLDKEENSALSQCEGNIEFPKCLRD